MPEVSLVAVADPNPVNGQAVAQIARTSWYADYRLLPERLDAAVVAVPTSAHLAVAGDLLRRGIPVLVEKPIALDLDQAHELTRLADEQQTLLQVGHVERFNPAWQAATPLIGSPRFLRSERYSPYAFRSTDISVVHDVMIHDIDLVLSLVRAPLRHVDAFGVCILGGLTDCVQARLVFADGCVADISANRVSPTTRRTMQAWSSEGCVTVDFAAREVTRYAPSELLKYGPSPLDRARLPDTDLEQLKSEVFGTYIRVEQPDILTRDALTDELQSFVNCVRTGAQPLVDGHAAVESMRVAGLITQRVAESTWGDHSSGALSPRDNWEHRRRAG
jgi:predicted dehydrogenase